MISKCLDKLKDTVLIYHLFALTHFQISQCQTARGVLNLKW